MQTLSKKIYLLDDDILTQKIMQNIFDDHQFTSLTMFSDPLDLINRMKTDPCDLLITDYSMPNMNGVEVTKIVTSFIPDLPVIVITVSDSTKLSEYSYESGATVFYKKMDIYIKPSNFIKIVKYLITDVNDLSPHLFWEPIFDSVGDLVLIHTKDGRIIKTNNKLNDVFHYEAGQIIGSKCCDFFSFCKPPHHCPVEEVISHESTTIMDFMFEGKQYLFTCAPLYLKGSLLGAITYIKDCTLLNYHKHKNKIGQILLEKDFINKDDLQIALNNQKSRKVGDILVENEKISTSQLNEALEHQKRNFGGNGRK